MLIRNFGLTALLALVLTACPPPPAPVVASIAISGTPTDNNLKMNAPVQLSAVATDTNGSTMSGVVFNWVSSNPEAVSVDASGLVTAKKFGTATITASSGGVSSTTVSQTTYGLEATFGTWASNTNSVFGTHRLYRFRVKTGQTIPAQTRLNFSMTGPTGWNNNTPSTVDITTTAATNSVVRYGNLFISPVSGNYQMSVTYDNETFVSQSVAVDITAAASTTSVSATWTSVPEAQVYYLRAVNNADGTSDKFSSFTTTTGATISGLTLDTTKNPSVFVYAFNYDVTSIGTITFTFPTNAKVASVGKAITIPTP
jgi:hypothetical protein